MDSYSSTDRLPPRSIRLWTGLLLPPLAWGWAGAIIWAVSANACQDGLPDLGFLSAGGVRALIGVIAGLSILFSAAGLWTALGAWRDAREDPGLTHVQGRSSASFMAAAGVLVSLSFLFGTVLFFLPSVMVGVCEFTR